MAVLEKGKSVGAHAVRAWSTPALRRLFRDRIRVEEMPFYGPVDREGVYYLTKGSRASDPGAADDAQRRELHRVAVRAHAVAGGAG